MPNRNKGLYLALLTALISGVSIFANKFAVMSLGNPLIFPTVKNALVGLGFLTILIASKKWTLMKTLDKKQIVQLIAIGIIGGSLPFYLFFTGLSQIPAINAAIINKTMVIWIAILAIPLLKEHITKIQGLAILLLFAGNLPIGGFKGLAFSKGEFMVLAATLIWTLETILAKKILTKVDPSLVATARMGFGSLILIAGLAITSPSGLVSIGSLTASQWLWIGLTSLTLFGYVSCWYGALKLSSAVSVSTVLVSATLVTNVLSAAFVTHSWHSVLTFQSLLMFGGILLLLRSQNFFGPKRELSSFF